MGRKAIDLKGQKFGFLEVLAQAKATHKTAKWLCLCVCGNEVQVEGSKLRSGKTKSCGCKRGALKVATMRTHGMSKTKIYSIWHSMVSRCLYDGKTSIRHKGRGITVCNDWRNDFTAFYDWAIANGYADGLTIDRIDNNGHYEPDNCRWVDNITQNNNRSTSKYIRINGEKKTIAEWARFAGIKYETLRSRLSRGVSGIELLKRKE